MIFPIVAYGNPILRKLCKDITPKYPELTGLIDSMFETMYASYGVGLAAPQIGKDIRLFIVDTSPFADMVEDAKEKDDLKGFKKVFINAQILEEVGEEWDFNEGCLSIPGINEEVSRQPIITMEYYDASFNRHEETFTGLIARVIQHEYDHIEGILFTDKLSSFKKRILKRKLENISKGKVEVDYPMKFPKK